MKTNLLLRLAAIAFILIAGFNSYAVEIVFDPSLLTPSDTGYYIGGYDKDEGGVLVHYDSCSNEFTESHHFESGEQNGFNFVNAMVMPDCPTKNSPSNVSLGYIQLGKGKYDGTDSMKICALYCPTVRNIESLTLELSCDVTPQPGGLTILYYIEYSFDGGETWVENNYVQGNADDKAGKIDIHNSSSSPNFNLIIAESATKDVKMRIRTNGIVGETDNLRHRVRIFKATLVAGEIVGISDLVKDQVKIEIRNNTIFSNNGEVTVMNLLGQIMGKGTSVQVNPGIYIVRNQTGFVKKVYIKE